MMMLLMPLPCRRRRLVHRRVCVDGIHERECNIIGNDIELFCNLSRTNNKGIEFDEFHLIRRECAERTVRIGAAAEIRTEKHFWFGCLRLNDVNSLDVVAAGGRRRRTNKRNVHNWINRLCHFTVAAGPRGSRRNTDRRDNSHDDDDDDDDGHSDCVNTKRYVVVCRCYIV